MKIKTNDNVLIIAGKDKGKTGKVEKVVTKKNALVVTGINMRKKHLKPSQQNPQGGIQEYSAPIQISKVKLVCPKCSKPTRVTYEITKTSKERKCKRCKEVI